MDLPASYEMGTLYEKPEGHAEVKLKTSDTSSSDLDSRIDLKAEQRLLLKTDLRVLPMLWLLFVLSFIDRINIGQSLPLPLLIYVLTQLSLQAMLESRVWRRTFT